jgi:hypothetical protein
MDTNEIWRGKTDDEVLAAYAQLNDYTDEGQQILRAEVERRQLTAPGGPFTSNADAVSTEPETLPSHPIARLWAGGYSLPVAYWGWGMGGTFVWLFVIDLATLVLGLAAVFLDLAFIAYAITVTVGIWRSANRYKGNPAWAALAKAAIAAEISGLTMRIVYLALAPR